VPLAGRRPLAALVGVLEVGQTGQVDRPAEQSQRSASTSAPSACRAACRSTSSMSPMTE
jgi:hypothetical protein